MREREADLFEPWGELGAHAQRWRFGGRTDIHGAREIAEELNFDGTEYFEIASTCSAFKCLVTSDETTDSPVGSGAITFVFGDCDRLERQLLRKLRKIKRFLDGFPEEKRGQADWRATIGIQRESPSPGSPQNCGVPKTATNDCAPSPAWTFEVGRFSVADFTKACAAICPSAPQYGFVTEMAICQVGREDWLWFPSYQDEVVNPVKAVKSGRTIFVDFHTPIYDHPIVCADGRPSRPVERRAMERVRDDSAAGFCSFGFLLRQHAGRLAIFKAVSESQKVRAVSNCPGMDDRMALFVSRFFV